MPKLRLTKKVIDGLATENKHGVRYFDKIIPAFGVKILPTGRKHFFVRYGSREKRKEYMLGSYGTMTLEMARQKAKMVLGEAVAGKDPLHQREEENNRVSFEEWIDQYLKLVSLRKKKPREDERYLRSAAKLWGKLDLNELGSEAIKREFLRIAETGKTTAANRWLASIRAALQEAWREGKIEHNPAMKVKALPEPSARTRVLTNDEYLKLHRFISDIPDSSVRAAFLLMMETGARLSEVLNAKWEHIDFEGSLWIIPSTKSGRQQTVPLLPEVIEMLNGMPRTSLYIVSGKQPDQPRRDLKRPWSLITKSLGLSDVHIHDLRRTFGLQITRTEGLHIASRLLRHSDIRVTERHYAPLDVKILESALRSRKKAYDQAATDDNGLKE